MTCPSRSFSDRVLRTTAWTTILFASAAYGQVAGRYAGATPPVTSMSAPGAGSVEGYVYWDTRAVTHNPAGACNGFSVTVIAGGHALTSGQFGAKYVGQVKSFLAGGTVVAYDVCTYAYDHVQENIPLSVQLAITQPSAFAGNVAPVNPLAGPITVINGQCNMLPAATPGAEDLTARPGSCQNMAFDVNFQLVPAGGTSRAGTLPRAGTAISPGNSGPLLTTGAQPTLLGNGGAASAATRPAAQPVITGGTTQAPGGLTPLGRSNTGSGAGTPSGGLQPIIPRNSLNGGTKTGLSGGWNKPLTNQDVLSLLSAGISEQNILTKIRNSASSFDVSNQGRASFDAQCAAIEPRGVSSGAWGTEISDIWQTMNNIAICQQTNGRGGEGACDATAPQAVLNNASGSTPPVPSKPAGRNQYEAITTQRGVTQDPTFSKFAGGGTAATNSGITNGTKKSDDLNPQPYPPKGISSSSTSLAAAKGQLVPPSIALKARLGQPRTAAKIVNQDAALRIAAITRTLQAQRNSASSEAAQMTKVGALPAVRGNVSTGPSQAMSATTTPGRAQSNLAAANAIPGPATGMLGGSNSQGVSNSLIDRQALAPNLILTCSHDTTMRILSVSGSEGPITFTTDPSGNFYTISGCSFGNVGPNAKVYIYYQNSFHQEFQIQQWSDNYIKCNLDPNLTRVGDQDNLTLVIQRSDGTQAAKTGFKFYAMRASSRLAVVPKQYFSLDKLNLQNLSDLTGGMYSPVNPTGYFPNNTAEVTWFDPDLAAITNPKFPSPQSTPPSGTDIYDFSHLAPGFDVSYAQISWPDPNAFCSGGSDSLVASSGNFGGQWNGPQLWVSWQGWNCNWNKRDCMLWSCTDIFEQPITDYAVDIIVEGPRGLDPWSGRSISN